MMLCNESIRVRTSPSSAIYVQTYIAVVGGEPSGTNLHPLMGRSNPIYTLAIPILVGEPHNTSKQTWGISWIMSCARSWRSSTGRLHTESWMCPPETHHKHLGKSYGKWGTWCGWLGDHLSERGRVAFPGATNLTSCPCTTRWSVEAKRTTSLPPAPVQPI